MDIVNVVNYSPIFGDDYQLQNQPSFKKKIL